MILEYYPHPHTLIFVTNENVLQQNAFQNYGL